MRILLTTRFYRNGQTTHVLSLCQELIRQGHEVLLIMTQLHDPSYQLWLRKQQIPIVAISNILRLHKRLEKWKPQIIHNHSAHTLQASLTLSKWLQIPSLTTVHYLDFQPLNLLTQQDAVVLISKEMHQHFEDLPVPTFVVENGVLLPPTCQKPRKFGQQALFLAQMTRAKEQNFRAVADSLLSWNWKVTSAGNWRHEGVKDLGWINHVNPLLAQTDLVIGTGRAVREAMAAGCAVWVLGTYCDGLVTPENVKRLEKTNFSGRASKERFSEQQAAIHLKQPSEPLFKELGTFSWQYAREHFSIQQMVGKLSDIYVQTLKNASKNRNSARNV